jgi:SagB-type dehydrogenase family enzyme
VEEELKPGLILTTLTALSLTCSAQELKPISLPAPVTEGGKPLMQCLKERHTSRDFSLEALPPQTLSNLLWAAWGINRPENGHRTAPSAMNWQEMDVYVALPEGVFLYDAKSNELKPVLAGDHRKDTGMQDFVGTAAVNLIYVADQTKMSKGSADDKTLYSAADAGFIAQNVYLFCASQDLACVVRGSIERDKLARTLQLRADQKIILAQSVGIPKNKL